MSDDKQTDFELVQKFESLWNAEWQRRTALEMEALKLKARVKELEAVLLELKHNSHHTIAEESWRIGAALLDRAGEGG